MSFCGRVSALCLLMGVSHCLETLEFDSGFTGTVTYYPSGTIYYLNNSALYDGGKTTEVISESTVDAFLVSIDFDGVYNMTVAAGGSIFIYYAPGEDYSTSPSNATYIRYYNYTSGEYNFDTGFGGFASSSSAFIATDTLVTNKVAIYVTLETSISDGGLSEIDIEGVLIPTPHPTSVPSSVPSSIPSTIPTMMPSDPTAIPSRVPSDVPSVMPSNNPTVMPTAPTVSVPTNVPTNPTSMPSMMPTEPSMSPSSDPSSIPTSMPSNMPTSIDSTNNSEAMGQHYRGCFAALSISCVMLLCYFCY